MLDPQALPEAQRLQALRTYDILHSAQESFFDELTAFTAYLFSTPVARIAFVAQQHVWHKASTGMPAQEVLPVVESLCSQVVQLAQPVAVLEELPFVPELMRQRQVRLYAAALLRSPQGYGLGTLCVAGTVPRTFTEPELAVLQALAELVVGALELRHQVLATEGADAWRFRQARLAEALREQLTLVRYLKARSPEELPVPVALLDLVRQRLPHILPQGE
ncbi:GAF domain-containing protein [Hymenobacter sp. YC55]|uniref:GAF domain-containing protein n=1 Tax=Hymenobacter sp. YC55 TaxID=3034019 RepID=UPI0023F66147|nr:GAF domain-containing protein [Hymenobacter sp. YC55]MDF7815750.1 GAF domain-containing protein [Hymenobacter sp. YC55]